MNQHILGDKKKTNFDDNLANIVNEIYDKMPDDFFQNEKNSKTVFFDYEVFSGKFVEQMPLLIEKNLVPAGFYDLMLKRVSVLGSEDEDFWWNNSFFSGDCIVYNPDGRFKIVLDSEHLRTVNSSTELVDGALILGNLVYESLQGSEFSKYYYRKYSRKLLTEEQAKKNPLWFALARGNQELLDAYVLATFKKAKDKHGKNTAMGVYLSDVSKRTFLRPWLLARLSDDDYYDSGAFGSHLNNVGGVVGVVTEAL